MRRAVRCEHGRGPGVSTVPVAVRASLLNRVVEVLADAAGEDDVQLAQTCRGILDGLVPVLAGTDRSMCPPQFEPEGPGLEDDSRVSSPAPLPLRAPAWASASVTEDDGITHEVLSPRHPEVVDRGVWGWSRMPTDVSLSQRDVLIDGQWIRTRPRIQVEGGSYSMEGARELHAALGELLATAPQEAETSEAT